MLSECLLSSMEHKGITSNFFGVLAIQNSPLVGALGLLQFSDIPRSLLIHNVKRNGGIEVKVFTHKLSGQLLLIGCSVL